MRFNSYLISALLVLSVFVITKVISNNIALSLGLVGALSVVRFRTAVKEPYNLAFLLFAICIGISIGANDFKEAAKKLIKKIRQTPQAKFLKIIVGGPATIDKPHFYNDVFADAQSKDANNAIIIANRLKKEIEKTKKEEKNKKA